MCFTPTMEEFRDFPRFIEYMEEQGAHKCGVAKVRFLRRVDLGGKSKHITS